MSHRDEGRHRNEFDDGVQERFDFPPVFGEKRLKLPKNNNNQHHGSRFESQIEKLLKRQVLGTSLPKFNGDVRFWSIILAIYRRQTHECQFNQSENIQRLRDALDELTRSCVEMLLLTRLFKNGLDYSR
jgi:hypothetical protein